MQTRTQSLVKCSLCAHSKDLTRALGQVPCEFYAKRPCLAYRVHIAVNAVVLALLPGLVLLALLDRGLWTSSLPSISNVDAWLNC